MKKVVFLLVMIGGMGVEAYGQIMFEKMYKDVMLPSQAQEVIQTSDGGYVLLKNRIEIACVNVNTSLIKTDSLGNILWSKYYSILSGCSNCDQPSYFSQTSDGGFIISGQIITYNSKPSLYLIKTDSAGNEQWRHVYSLPSYFTTGNPGYGYSVLRNRGIPVKQMDDGGFIFQGNIYNLDSNVCSFIMIKTDSSGSTGSMLWSKRFNTTYRNAGNNFDLIGNGISQGIIFCSEINDVGTSSLLITRIDNNGNMLWSKMYPVNSTQISIGGNYISKTMDNGFIVTGRISINQSNWNIFALKTDSLGNIEWLMKYDCDSIYHCWGITIKQTYDGNYIMAGTIALGAHPEKANSILLKIDNYGNYLWSKSYFVNNKYDYTINAIQTSDGGYAFCGCVYDNIPNDTNSYVYFVKTDSVGNTNCNDSSFTVAQNAINLISLMFIFYLFKI